MEELLVAVEAVKTDYEKFAQKGNKAAGTRARVGLQRIKKLAQDLRVEIQKKKNEG